MLPFVSIVIPTYRDWFRLNLCLQSLADQSYPKERFEIIVVNNLPEDHLPAEFELPENCFLIEEKKPGSYAARNAGLKVSKGEIIGFTDSDCIAEKNWIGNAVTFLSDHREFQRLGGAINIFFKEKKPSNVEMYDQLFAFPQEAYVKSGNAVTANMFAYKYLFEEVGFFDDSLLSGGDYKWGQLAQKYGYAIGYAPEVSVDHPARSTVKELVSKAIRVGKGQAAFRRSSEKSFIEKGMAYLRLLKPRHWEMGMIFKKGRHFSLRSKLYLIFLRHYVVISGDLARLIYSEKNGKDFLRN